jgi:hypothetical protein
MTTETKEKTERAVRPDPQIDTPLRTFKCLGCGALFLSDAGLAQHWQAVVAMRAYQEGQRP